MLRFSYLHLKGTPEYDLDYVVKNGPSIVIKLPPSLIFPFIPSFPYLLLYNCHQTGLCK
jgi:hypothetical protein